VPRADARNLRAGTRGRKVPGPAIAALGALLLAGGATAQTYPVKPVRLIVAFPAGGGSDVVGRILAQKLGERLGQQMVVENRAGAGGSIGTEAAVRSAPDGYTLALGSTSEIAINPAVYTKLSYDTVRDLVGVAPVASTPMALLVHPALPVRAVKDVIALARSRPGQINYSSAGNGSTTHLASEIFRSAARVDLVHVPYKGAPPALADLVGGQVHMMISTLPAAMSLVQAGRLRALAVTTAKRAESMPDVPTMQEAGLPGFDVEYWYGIFAPSALAKDLAGRLHTEIAQTVRQPDVVASLAKQGAAPMSMSPAEFAAFVKAEVGKWGSAARAAGVKLD
jgi:tripartite-type tricarboxylate transporter receptor subunit TctC